MVNQPSASSIWGGRGGIGRDWDGQHTLLIVIVDIQLHSGELGHGCRFLGGLLGSGGSILEQLSGGVRGGVGGIRGRRVEMGGGRTMEVVVVKGLGFGSRAAVWLFG